MGLRTIDGEEVVKFVLWLRRHKWWKVLGPDLSDILLATVGMRISLA